MNIYVGNLSNDVKDSDLREAFASYGEAKSVSVIVDKFTGEPRGFGFVEMASAEEGLAAIKGLNGTDLKGQSLKVNEARERTERRASRY